MDTTAHPDPSRGFRAPGVVFGALALALTGGHLPAERAMATDFPEPKAFFHVDMEEPRRVSATIVNASYMASHYEGQLLDYDIRMVIHAFGVRYVTSERMEDTAFEMDDELAEERDGLKARLKSLVDTHEISLELCENTLHEAGLTVDDVELDVELVPFGVTRITELQNEHGFAYIKMN